MNKKVLINQLAILICQRFKTCIVKGNVLSSKGFNVTISLTNDLVIIHDYGLSKVIHCIHTELPEEIIFSVIQFKNLINEFRRGVPIFYSNEYQN